MEWVLVDNIKNDEKIYKGAGVRFYNTAKGLSEQCALPCGKDGHMNYFVKQVYDNREYFQLTCLSEGEVGNITCVLLRDNDNYFVTGKEIKRMLQTDLYNMFIHKHPMIVIK